MPGPSPGEHAISIAAGVQNLLHESVHLCISQEEAMPFPNQGNITDSAGSGHIYKDTLSLCQHLVVSTCSLYAACVPLSASDGCVGSLRASAFGRTKLCFFIGLMCESRHIPRARLPCCAITSGLRFCIEGISFHRTYYA